MALVGPNGAGKSTLLHVLAGVVTRTRARSTCAVRCGCCRRRRSGCRASGAAGLVPGADRAARGRGAHAARPLPARAEAIGRPLGRLSPGERARVHVAAIVGAGAELILLDEPTNHLDFDTLEVIEAALRAYRGTLVIATHDRA